MRLDTRTLHSNGKLLLTGEYFVLDGAAALALPCRFGQSTVLILADEPVDAMDWVSYDETGEIWFEGVWSAASGGFLYGSDDGISERLTQVMHVLREDHAGFWSRVLRLEMKAGFPLAWGLGSSATLIYNLAQACAADPFWLLDRTFGGSGYDIACAGAAGPLIYDRKPGMDPAWQAVSFVPPGPGTNYFVYLGSKQDSREAIRSYRTQARPQAGLIGEISAITMAVSACTDYSEWLRLLRTHEDLTADFLGTEPVGRSRFADFPGVVKSLGAWGGDFVLASHPDPVLTYSYFRRQGLDTILPYDDMVLGAVPG